MKVLYICLMMIFLLSLFSCGNGNIKPVKPDSASTEPVISTQPEPLRQVASEDPYQKTDFPLSDNYYQLSSIRGTANRVLVDQLHFYWLVENQFPNDMDEFLNSGFPIFWPRNVSTGKPIQAGNVQELFSSHDPLYAYVQYEKIDNDHSRLKYVNFDLENTTETSIMWKVNTIDIPKEDLMPDDLKRHIYVEGGIKSITLISDYNQRRLYSLYGQFTGFLSSQTSHYLRYNKILPSTIDELLDSTRFVIKENFLEFINLLKDSNADFFWGFDYSNNLGYSYLAFDGDVFISGCVNWNSESGLPVDCDINAIDTSSPIFSSRQLSSFDIPDEYMISIKDIPVK